MLLKRVVQLDDNGVEDVIEAIYDSSNLLKTTYLPKQQILYIYFKKGVVYSYYNVDKAVYTEFETAESQGTYHNKNFKNNNKYPYSKEFKMLNFEIQNINEEIEEALKNKLSQSNNG